MQPWRCNNHTKCKALLEQHGTSTYKEIRPHTCENKGPHAELKHRMYADIKQKATELSDEVRKTPSSRLVNPIARKYFEESVKLLEPGEVPLVLRKQTTERVCNRARPRAVHPTDPFFTPDPDHLPKEEKFLQREVPVGKKHRHLVFATSQQLEIARGCKRLYLDGTFRLAKKPFLQLFSIHGFIRSGEDMVQLPLFYILMTRRKIADYTKVCTFILYFLLFKIITTIFLNSLYRYSEQLRSCLARS